MTDKPKDDKQTTREIMDKIHAMTPEEFNRFMWDNFMRHISRPVTNGERS